MKRVFVCVSIILLGAAGGALSRAGLGKQVGKEEAVVYARADIPIAKSLVCFAKKSEISNLLKAVNVSWGH